jgi:hypothetical protein
MNDSPFDNIAIYIELSILVVYYVIVGVLIFWQ